jgi:NTP pyrophosphatase (non-canonical NTP hydrolase)
MQEGSLKDALQEAEIEIEEIAMQLADMLGAALYFAGVKREKLPDAVDAYLQGIDDTLGDEDGEMGFEEVVKVIEDLRRTNPKLFK